MTTTPEPVTLALGDHDSRLVPLASLDEPPNPSRDEIGGERLDELADNIRKLGVKSHLIVVLERGRYEIVAGHRRYHAAKRAGLAQVPCDIYVDRERANEAVQYAENRFREDLTPTEEAAWFDDLLERKHGGDVDRLAAFLGEKRAYIEQRVNLFRGDRRVFEALAEKRITIGVAELLNRCSDEQYRRMYLHNAVTYGATVAIVSGWLAEWKQTHAPANNAGASAPPPAPRAAVAEMNFYTCALCGKTDNVHTMQPVNIHAYCFAASFADMLELWSRRHEYTRYPRTLDEALALAHELGDRFPGFLAGD